MRKMEPNRLSVTSRLARTLLSNTPPSPRIPTKDGSHKKCTGPKLGIALTGLTDIFKEIEFEGSKRQQPLFESQEPGFLIHVDKRCESDSEYQPRAFLKGHDSRFDIGGGGDRRTASVRDVIITPVIYS